MSVDGYVAAPVHVDDPATANLGGSQQAALMLKLTFHGIVE